MANQNSNLNSAKMAKKDEFYTQLVDIENEMRHYRKHFKGKVIFCNCDDPFESNFFKYFVLNFNRLGLKKLICTSYTNSPIAGTQLSFADIGKQLTSTETAYKAIITEVYDATGDGGIDMLDVAELFKLGKNTLEELKGNGDFRSDECLELMDESDIVVTNPPFSLFREYVETLMKHEKKFIIIGHQNVITYKEVFPFIKNNQMWLGYGFKRNCAHFVSPYKDTASDLDHKEGMIRVSGVVWFTNLDIKKRHERLILIKRYDPESYPNYVNYEAIDVSRAVDIPCDYAGLMGVPITFMEKYNPEQFEIVGISSTLAKPMKEIAESGTYMAGGPRFYTPRLKASDLAKGYKWHREYDRIVIRNLNPEQPKGK